MAKKRKKKWPFHKLLEVDWIDTCVSFREWTENTAIRSAADVLKCKTVGYPVKSSKKSITLVMTQGMHNQSYHEMTIPVGCITKIKVLR